MEQVAVDLHIHSVLSPCGEPEMTPNNIVNMAIIKELDFIAVTDHNSAKNLPAVMAVPQGDQQATAKAEADYGNWNR